MISALLAFADPGFEALIRLLILALVVGLILWLVTTYAGLPAPIARVVQVIVAIVFLLYCLRILAIL